MLGLFSLTKFTRAVSQVPGFATREAETVRVQAGAGDEQPVSPWRGACLTQRRDLDSRLFDFPKAVGRVLDTLASRANLSAG
jgi:hypothetical protein